MINEEIKPTLKKPVNTQSQGFEKNFKKTMNQYNVKLNETDGMLSEVEQSLKKKIFSLAKMEALVFSDSKLSAVYEGMAENGEEKYGYHYNETIMNMLFNDYVLNSPKYLQKYKQAVPKEKTRRDKSGINQLKKTGVQTMQHKSNIKPQKLAQTGLKPEVAENDEQLTKVQFLVNEKDPENPDLFAYFPEEIDHDEFRTAYSHVGQHSAAHPKYAAESRPATPEEYADLKAELESIGYNLEVINSTNETTGAGSAGGFAPALGIQQRQLEEDTTTSSVGGSGMGSGGYAGPAAWGGGDLMKGGSKSKIMRKPIWKGGKIIQESKINYLIDPSGFEKYAQTLNEDDRNKEINYIDKKSDAYGTETNNMSKGDLNVIDNQLKTGKVDKPNLKSMEETPNTNNVNVLDSNNSQELAKRLKTEIDAPFVSAQISTLGGVNRPSVMLAISIEPKENWKNGIFENSKYLRFHITSDGIIELFTKQYTIPEKFRKTRFTNIDDAITKIKTYVEKIKNITNKPEDNMKEDTQTMIQTNGTSMSNKAVPTGDQSGNMDKGMAVTENKDDMKLLEELNKELDAYSIHHNKLKKMSEDRRPSSLILKDRLGDENRANFKKDMKNSDTKQVIDVEKELEWKDQQTDVGKDPQKLGREIEDKELKVTNNGQALKDVGNSANDKGDEIPKRNLTTEEQDEVNMYRLGLGDYVYDNEPGKRFEDRMKADMGDKLYKLRQDKLAFRGKAPMYNKDTQPVEDGVKKAQYNKYKSGWNEREGIMESAISGKYFNNLGKRSIIDFNLNEVVEIADAKEIEKLQEVNLEGMGNTYNNKVDINEGAVKAMNNYKFYTDSKKVFVMKNPVQNLNENEQKIEKRPIRS